jgi:pyrroline-5-carboxylate reductase
VAPGYIVAADAKPARLAELKKEFKIKTSKSNPEAAKGADVVVLAVKPQILDKVLTELKKSRKKDALILSMAAGYPTSLIEKFLGGSPRVVRAMPNIAAAVGQAATALCRGKHARKKEFDLAKLIFSVCGTVEEVDETLMDAVTGLSGTGPMYVFIIIEALSDAGVRVGLGRDIATRLAVQTVLGAAGMVEKTGRHPIFLKDLVTSPGGTAINALYSMEKTGLRAVIMDAVEAATTRSRELGQPFEDSANK